MSQESWESHIMAGQLYKYKYSSDNYLCITEIMFPSVCYNTFNVSDQPKYFLSEILFIKHI